MTALTLTPTPEDVHNILQLSSPKTTVSFRFKEVLGEDQNPTDGDKAAHIDRHWQGILDVLYELSGRPEVQAMFEERGLIVERKRLTK